MLTALLCFAHMFSFLEIHFMWAGHQVHHSSEYYNLSTALRQSAVQRYTSWVRHQCRHKCKL